MEERIIDRKTAMAWQKRYGASAPKVGEAAPDFELSDAEGNNPKRLSSYQEEKPVALVFGSFT